MNYLAVSLQQVQRSERRYLQAKLRICQECKDYVIAREITTVLKLTVDNAILELCDSCDLLAL